jgi:hypothetical protein
MHILAVSLLALLAGTLLLAKIKKEELGKFFTYISWFFIVVGFLLFIGFVAGGICKMSHCCKSGKAECCQEMMMKDCGPGMHAGGCCSPDMGKGSCDEKGNCMHHDSIKKCCSEQKEVDTLTVIVPKSE